jgi:hypothetical protein
VPRALISIVLLVALGCCGPSSSPPDASAAGPDASAGLDASLPVDAGDPPDAAMPPDAEAEYDAGPVCGRQSECGDPVAGGVVGVCVRAHCRAPGPLVSIDFDNSFGPSFTQAGSQPQVQMTRLIFGNYVDGTPVTCADLTARSGATQATRANLDTDPQINQAYRSLTVLSWSGTAQGWVLFRIFDDVPRADGYVLWAEAWYGGREQNQPTGSRAAFYCAENIDLLAVPDGTKIPVVFGP